MPLRAETPSFAERKPSRKVEVSPERCATILGTLQEIGRASADTDGCAQLLECVAEELDAEQGVLILCNPLTERLEFVVHNQDPAFPKLYGDYFCGPRPHGPARLHPGEELPSPSLARRCGVRPHGRGGLRHPCPASSTTTSGGAAESTTTWWPSCRPLRWPAGLCACTRSRAAIPSRRGSGHHGDDRAVRRQSSGEDGVRQRPLRPADRRRRRASSSATPTAGCSTATTSPAIFARRLGPIRIGCPGGRGGSPDRGAPRSWGTR